MSSTDPTNEIESAVDLLYQVDRKDFVKARTALVTALKKAGAREAALRVQGLKKSNLPAWAVNQLFWKSREVFDRLLEAGDGVREAQQTKVRGLGGEQLAKRMETRRTALRKAVRTAESYLLQSNNPITTATTERIEATLETAALFGSDSSQPVNGRLVTDLERPGFEALMAFAVSATLPKSPEPETRKEKQAQATPPAERQQDAQRIRQAVRTHSSEVTTARKARELAEARLEKAIHEKQRIRAAIGSLETELAKLQRRLRTAEDLVDSETQILKDKKSHENAAVDLLQQSRAALKALEGE